MMARFDERPICRRLDAKAFNGERRIRQRGSLGSRLVATARFCQRQRVRLISLGRSIVAATLLRESKFRQSGGPYGRIVAATLFRERSFCRRGSPSGFLVAASLRCER
jgi:hypothetical protein